MEWLNYHHLLYFYTVAREGSVTEASKVLRLAQPTLSGQIRKLEESLGEKLFVRQGRQLVLTDAGRHVYGYAEEIFTLGREMMGTLRGHPSARPARLLVGVADAVPKLLCHHVLDAALQMDDPVHLVCRGGKTDDLLSALAVQAFDLVLTDAPIAPHVKLRAFNHPLGECGIAFFAERALAQRFRRGFPHSLDGAPLVLPTENTMLRSSLEQWFHSREIRPRVVAEVEDTALMKVFGQQGLGIFAVPDILASDVRRQYGVRMVGRTAEVRERFYAITVERRIKNPAVAAIAAAARERVFT